MMIPHWLRNGMSAIHHSWRGKQNRSRRAGMKHRLSRMEDLEPRWLCTVSAIDHSYTTTVGQTLNIDATQGALAGASTTATPPSLIFTFMPGSHQGIMLHQSDGAFSYTPDPGYIGIDSFQYMVTDSSYSSVMKTISISVTAPTPVLANVSVMYGAGRTVTLTGTVASGDLGMTTVGFSGVVNGSVGLSPDGSFSYTATASGLGTVSAQAQGVGQASNIVQITLAPPAPVLQNFTIARIDSQVSSDIVALSGTVTTSAGQFGTLMVSFSGAVAAAAATSCNGEFYSLLVLTGTESGTVVCMVLDAWGNASNTIEANLDLV